jgi:uncharacterized protein (TIGR00106 family)
MLVEFSTYPLGAGESVSDSVAEILDLVDKSGLPYQFTPMATIVEGEWDEVLSLIKECHQLCRKKHHRVSTRIHIDDRKGATGRLRHKVEVVKEKVGRPLSTGSGASSP